MVVDAIARTELALASLSPYDANRTERSVAGCSSVTNPVDVLGDARSTRYARALELVCRDDGVDASIVLLTPQAVTDVEQTARVITHAAHTGGKPIVACSSAARRSPRGAHTLMMGTFPCSPIRSAPFAPCLPCGRTVAIVMRFDQQGRAARCTLTSIAALSSSSCHMTRAPFGNGRPTRTGSAKRNDGASRGTGTRAIEKDGVQAMNVNEGKGARGGFSGASPRIPCRTATIRGPFGLHRTRMPL